MMNRYASLKQGLAGAWCPSLGASGYRLLDRSGYGNHGTLTNMDPGTDWVPSGGKLALDFDGVDDRVPLGNATFFGFTAISVSFWFRRSQSAKAMGLIQGNSEGSRIFFVIGDDNKFYIGGRFASGDKYSSSSASTADLGNWTHYCGVLITNTSIASGHFIYVNGLEYSISHTGTTTINSVPSFTTPIDIGERFTGSGTGWVQGQIDDVRIYNRALTPQEIRLLYTGGRGVGLLPERIKHRRKTSGTNRRRRLICGANC